MPSGRDQLQVIVGNVGRAPILATELRTGLASIQQKNRYAEKKSQYLYVDHGPLYSLVGIPRTLATLCSAAEATPSHLEEMGLPIALLLWDWRRRLLEGAVSLGQQGEKDITFLHGRTSAVEYSGSESP
jgi:hypothetical protein